MARLLVSGETRCLSLKKSFLRLQPWSCCCERNGMNLQMQSGLGGGSQPVGPVGSCVRRKCIEFFNKLTVCPKCVLITA